MPIPSSKNALDALLSPHKPEVRFFVSYRRNERVAIDHIAEMIRKAEGCLVAAQTMDE